MIIPMMQSFDFYPHMLHGRRTMPAEQDRTRLIGEIASVLSDGTVPAEARAAALTLIGWLARRMPGEQPCRDGVEEMVRRACSRPGGSSGSNGHSQK
jgi:hypothetical protein